MSTPRFTADLSLCNADRRYQFSALEHRTDQTIQPALGGRDAPGMAGCLEDCMDAHPGWTAARCRAYCTTPAAPVSTGPESAPSSDGLVIYGNYCGPGHSGNNYTLPPWDAVDTACMTHDLCYEATNYFNCGCDRALLNSLPGAIAASPTSAGKLAGIEIYNYFSGSACLCSDWRCIFNPRPCIGRGGQGAIC